MKLESLGTMDEYPLEKFTNEEFYHIISSLLGLGDPGFISERLYLSFDQNQLDVVADVKFLFLTTNLIQGDNGQKEVTEYTVGKIDREFDGIEIYRWQCDPETMSPENSVVDVPFIRSTLHDQSSPFPFRLITFLKGINRIISEGGFEKRADNDLFNLRWHVDIPYDIQQQLSFGQIGQLGTNFSGNYFLIAEPDKTNVDRGVINSFHISGPQMKGLPLLDDESVYVSQRFIDSISIQLFDGGTASSVLIDAVTEDHKKYEDHKARILLVLNDTVLSLLTDLSPAIREQVLENETPEELVIFCKEKYDNEFDLNVGTLGIAGAHEIAWQEALAILSEDHSEPN